MYCHHCGEDLPRAARFCSHCGRTLVAPEAGPAAAVRGGSAAATAEPVAVLRPVFQPGAALLALLPLQLFFAVWGGGFFGGFCTVGLQALGVDFPEWLPFVGFGLLFFLGLPLVVWNAQRRTYEATEYRFYADRLEYHEGFFTVEEKELALRHVSEVHLRKGLGQRRYGLGTIVLATPGSAGSRGGVRLVDVPEPDRVYERVRELVRRAQADAPPERRAA